MANMAIWCMIMIALSDKHHLMQQQHLDVPVNLWGHCRVAGGAMTYRQCFSLRELPESATAAVEVTHAAFPGF